MTDLQRLIEAVECGDSKDAVRYYAGRVLNPGYAHALNACAGSLDAAKALHDALLPERAVSEFRHIKRYEEESFVYVHLASDVYKGRAVNPARAWLLAILKAYQAQQVKE